MLNNPHVSRKTAVNYTLHTKHMRLILRLTAQIDTDVFVFSQKAIQCVL